MRVYVDESGDAGRDIRKGASELFTVAMVVFEDEDIADAVDARITLLRHELGLAPDYEFKFQKTPNRVRTAFLEAISPYTFFIVGVVINKAALPSGGMLTGSAFYDYVCSMAFESVKSYLDNALVKIDGEGERTFKRKMEGYLKKRLNDPASQVKRIRSVAIEDSKASNLIQAADMVCGAIARSYHGDKKDAAQFRKITKHRELSVLFLPEAW